MATKSLVVVVHHLFLTSARRRSISQAPVSAVAVGVSIGVREAAQSIAGKKVTLCFRYPETRKSLGMTDHIMVAVRFSTTLSVHSLPLCFPSMESHLNRFLDSSPFASIILGISFLLAQHTSSHITPTANYHLSYINVIRRIYVRHDKSSKYP
jgi:hypothetical protein